MQDSCGRQWSVIMEEQQQSKDKQAFSVPRLFTSCFGLGWLPIAPGTWGSLPAAIAFGLLCYFNVPAIYVFLAMLVLTIDGSLHCILLAPAAIEATGKKDPGEVVVDELAGQALTFLLAPILAGPFMEPCPLGPIAALVGFMAFRFFDILKPPPCRKLERLPHGVGILADDLMAGVYAAGVLQIYIHFFGG